MKTNMRYFATAFLSLVAVCLYAESEKTFQVGITMQETSANYVALQFDIELPDGVTIAEDQEGHLMTKLGVEGTDHQFRVAKVGENTYRFLAYSLTNAQLPINDTPLVYFSIKDENNLSKEEQEKLVSEALLVEEDAQSNVPEESAYEVDSELKGDVNKDKSLTAQDASLTLQDVSGKVDFDGFVITLSDVNGDGEVTAQDASLMLQNVAGKINW